MNIIAKQFSYYPKEIRLYTLIIILQICRITFFSSSQVLGAESMTGSVILLLVCILLNSYVIFRERESLGKSLYGTKIFLAYLIWGIFSLFWSPVPNAIFTLPKCLEVLSSFLMIAVVMWKINDKGLSLLYLLQLCTIASLLGYFPGLLTGRIWQHSSFFPMTGAMGCILALGLRKIYEIPYLKFYMIINFLIMLLGTSSATYIAFVFGLLIYLSQRDRGINIIQFAGTCILFGILYWLLVDDIIGFIFAGKSTEAIQSASGREYIWNMAIEAWKNNPWFGQGFIVAERNLHVISHSEVLILSAHNGYISVLLGTGIIGCIIFGVFYLKTIVTCLVGSFYTEYGREMTVLLPILAILTINNLSVHALGGAWDISTPAVFSLLILINTLKFKTNAVD